MPAFGELPCIILIALLYNLHRFDKYEGYVFPQAMLPYVK